MAQPEVQNGGGSEAEAEAKAKAVSFTALKPQLFVEAPKASDAISFYKAAFGAQEVGRTLHPKRKADQELPLILSAQLRLAGTTLLISDASDDSDSAAAAKTVNAGFILCLETDDEEAAVAMAVAAGATSEGGEVANVEAEGACAGGRVGKVVKDPYGFTWHISSAQEKTADVEA